MFNKIIKTFIYAVILVLCGLIIFRCCANADRSTFTDLAVTPELVSAWADGEMEVLRLEENASEIAPDGYFTWLPGGRSCGCHITETPMDFYLCQNDDVSTLRAPDLILEESRSIYRYRKLVWNNVDIGDANWQVYMDRQDGEYSVAPIRYVEQEYRNYKLSGGEKKQLRSQN